MENYFFDTTDEEMQDNIQDSRVYVLIIYDIIDNKRRLKLAKYLNAYGFRVQKSCFEAKLTKKKYQQMLEGLKVYATKNDSIRVYKIIGQGQVTVFGQDYKIDDEEVIVI